MDQEIRFCRAPDGVKLAYALTGNGPPVVMSATWLTHLEHQWRSLAWRPWLDAFSARHTLLRYDSRGCGLSDPEPRHVSFETWVEDFSCVIDAASVDRFALVGTCQGGPIAIEYARRHPERVTHLVLYGTYTRGRLRRGDVPNEIEKARLLLDLLQLGWGRENHAFVQVWASQFQPGGTLEHLRSWCEQQTAATSPQTARRLLEIGFRVDVTESAKRLSVPTLVLHAERDAVVPLEEGRRLAGLIPNCRFVQLDGENHMPLAEEPAWQRLRQELREFLSGAPRERAAAQPLPALRDLTPRERSVLECIASGMSNREIASRLRLSEKTVRNHVTRVFDKIGVQHRYEAIVRARDAGLGRNAARPTATTGTSVPRRREHRRSPAGR